MDFVSLLLIIAQQVLILFLDILFCLLTIMTGLLGGKLIVSNVDKVFGLNDRVNSNIQVYKEAISGVTIMLVILRFLTIPIGQKIQGGLKRSFLPVPDCVSFTMVIVKFLFMPLCYITLIVLLDGRYCQEFPSRFFKYSFDLAATFEDYFTTILTMSFAFPIYGLFKFYWTSEKSADQINLKDDLNILLEKHDVTNKNQHPAPSIDWRCQFFGTFLELSEYFLFAGFIFTFANSSAFSELGRFCTVASYPLASLSGFLMISLETLNPRIAKLGGKQIRVYQNFLYLAYFIPRTFMLFYQNEDEVFCNYKGQLVMKNRISKDFVIFSSICVYSMWKILVLCKFYSRKVSKPRLLNYCAAVKQPANMYFLVIARAGLTVESQWMSVKLETTVHDEKLNKTPLLQV